MVLRTIFIALMLCGLVVSAVAGGPIEMGLYGLSGRDREGDWAVFSEELRERGVRVESTDVMRARVVVSYEEELLFPKWNPKQRLKREEVEKRLGQVVREGSTGAFDLRPLGAGGMESGFVDAEVRIGVLDCKGCRYGAYTLLMRVEGIERVWVDAERLVVRFAYDRGRVRRIYSSFFEPDQMIRELALSALRKGRVEVLD
jgi:hypothetical protein